MITTLHRAQASSINMTTRVRPRPLQKARRVASVIGAGIVDLMNLVTVDAPLLAYGAAFAGEAALLIGALLTYGRLRMRAARVLSAS